MNINKPIVAIFALGLIAGASGSFAAKGGKGGGKPPPEPPPPCADTFPGFLYTVEDTRKGPAELHLSSSDGCRSELVGVVPNLRLGTATVHITEDQSKGVILWSEDHNNQYIVQRVDFAVDDSGKLSLEQPVTVLPLSGEEALPGDFLFFFDIDIWGDATHDSLYMAVLRIYEFNSGPDVGGSTSEVLIYDLNDLTDVKALPDTRVIYNEKVGAGGVFEFGDWLDADPTNLPDCSSVPFPQFVPTCYRTDELRFNPSGTRLYLQCPMDLPDGQRWDTVMRLHIDMSGGSALADWSLTGPELVYTGTTEGTTDNWPHGMLARPDAINSNLPNPEIIGMSYLDRSGNQTVGVGAFLNADDCATRFAALSSGNLPGGAPDLWTQCLENQLLNGSYNHSWQSPDALLTSHLPKRHYNIYRRYVSGEFVGIEELLIENGRFPDTGF